MTMIVVLTCLSRDRKSWPVPYWISVETAEEEGYWSYKSVTKMDTKQVRQDLGSEVVLTSSPSLQTSDISLWNSPNIAVPHENIVSGAFLGVVLTPFEAPRIRRSIFENRKLFKQLEGHDSRAFPIEYDLDRTSEFACLLEIQRVVKFASRSSMHNAMILSRKYQEDLLAEWIVAKLHSTLLGIKNDGKCIEMRSADGCENVADVKYGTKTVIIMSVVSPIDPEEISCLCRLMAEHNILTVLLLAPGVRAAFIDEGDSNDGVKIHIGRQGDIERVVQTVNGVKLTSNTKPICVTIETEYIKELVIALQNPRKISTTDNEMHVLSCQSPVKVLYVGGLLCRAYPGVHDTGRGNTSTGNEDPSEEEELMNGIEGFPHHKLGQNSISFDECEAMRASYVSIALSGSTDMCRASADIIITAGEEDNTYFEFYDRFSPLLYLIEQTVDIGDELYVRKGKRNFCMLCI